MTPAPCPGRPHPHPGLVASHAYCSFSAGRSRHRGPHWIPRTQGRFPGPAQGWGWQGQGGPGDRVVSREDCPVSSPMSLAQHPMPLLPRSRSTSVVEVTPEPSSGLTPHPASSAECGFRVHPGFQVPAAAYPNRPLAARLHLASHCLPTLPPLTRHPLLLPSGCSRVQRREGKSGG